MNKLLIFSALLIGSSMANASEYRLVSSDNSELSALCIKAVESHEALVESARSIGMEGEDLAELRCNGKTLPIFLGTLHARENTSTVQTVAYAFNKNDGSELTELCYAAVKSEQEYEQVKDAYFGDEQNIEEEVRCNGMPLKDFARKYRNRAFTASTR
ncbi:MAG: hypothetical protein V4628_04525 [Pseudomonadota bacterium]